MTVRAKNITQQGTQWFVCPPCPHMPLLAGLLVKPFVYRNTGNQVAFKMIKNASLYDLKFDKMEHFLLKSIFESLFPSGSSPEMPYGMTKMLKNIPKISDKALKNLPENVFLDFLHKYEIVRKLVFSDLFRQFKLKS